MNKENNKSAAGLRRSAIAERIRLREEWSELKGDTPVEAAKKSSKQIVLKIPQKNRNQFTKPKPVLAPSKKNIPEATCSKQMSVTSEVLRGIVALVDVGAESKALALRAALMALGASVVPTWSPIVTHLIWAQGGCRATRAKARALACRLVSPLWVEACAAANERLSEQAFPAAARASDLPSPRTLKQLLKRAEMENIPLVDLLSDNDDEKPMRLRISSDTDRDTTDTSRDTSRDTSHDVSKDTSTEVESRVNTAPRRAMPISISPAPKTTKSRRKLFTQKEADETKTKSDDESDSEAPPKPKKPLPGPASRRNKRELARAERMAKQLVASCAPTAGQSTQPSANIAVPRIVLTGMGKTERQTIMTAILSMKGRVQKNVTKRTSHVILGSCSEDTHCSGIPQSLDTSRTLTSPRKNLCRLNMNVSGISNIPPDIQSRVVHRSDILKARTLNALLGAARGCRVVTGQWALDSARHRRWLHHHGYDVPHLRKISQKARIERTALGRMRSEYAYDVFNGMRVRISTTAQQRDAAIQLLQLCGAVVLDEASGSVAENSYDVTIGGSDGEVSSKWVFDSVAAARMRTTRRYVNNTVCNTLVSLTNR